MEVLLLTIPISLFLAGTFVFLFMWCVNKKQFQDLESKKYIIFSKSKGKNYESRK